MFFEIAKKGENKLWQYLLTVVAVILGYFIGQLPLTGVLFMRMNQDPNIGVEELADFTENPDFSLFGINNNIGFLLMLLIFVVAMLALWLCIKFLHFRSLKDLITAAEKINWNKILWGFGVWMALGMIFEVFMYFYNPDSYSFQLNLSNFIPLVFIAVLLLPIQTSFEELFFRGYLMQGIGMATKSKLMALLITSILFGLIHGTNPEVAKYGFWSMQLYYISAGLVLGIMTIMDDSLELALGVHAATNIYGAVILSYEGSALQTDTLFRSGDINPSVMFVFLIGMSALFLYLCSRKYNWPSFNKLLEKIEENDETSSDSSITDTM